MAESQQHGFLFEQHVLAAAKNAKDANGEPIDASDTSYTDRFDIPGALDPAGQSIPTCVKIAKRAPNGRVRVDMADARRTLSLASVPTTRLVVGVYEQMGDAKHVSEVREYLIEADTWKQASGGVDAQCIADFHQQLSQGTPQEARAFAQTRKAELVAQHPGVLKWAPKIDSKTQRRLQCSVYLDELDTLVSANPGSRMTAHTPETTSLWGLALPIEIPSPPRTRRSKKQDKDDAS
jgi:hypothetical protein